MITIYHLLSIFLLICKIFIVFLPLSFFSLVFFLFLFLPFSFFFFPLFQIILMMTCKSLTIRWEINYSPYLFKVTLSIISDEKETEF